jgi:hypothetical protein
MKTKAKLKQKILDSIKHAREELKYTLVSDEWGHPEHKCACALGCVIAQDNPDNLCLTTSDNFNMVQELLEVDESWIDSFIEGFDGNGGSKDSKVPAAWDMGREIAVETKPIEYHKWDGEYHG